MQAQRRQGWELTGWTPVVVGRTDEFRRGEGCFGGTTGLTLHHGIANDTNVQGRSGTRLTAMRGSGMEICGRQGQLWWMAEWLAVVVADVWEEEVFVGREACS